MTATTKWIEDAIAGGWGEKHDRFILHEVNQEIEFCTYFKQGELDYHGEATEVGQHKSSTRLSLGIALLDPLAWQAVGRTRGWEDSGMGMIISWKREWHHFIDHLASGLSIEDSLKAIE